MFDRVAMSSNAVEPDPCHSAEQSSCGLIISPAALTFGIETGLVPVGESLTQKLTLQNPQSSDVSVVVFPVVDHASSTKFQVNVKGVQSFVVKAGAVETVCLKLKVLYSTKVSFEVRVTMWQFGLMGTKEVRFPFAMDSQPSTKLDPADLNVMEPFGRGGFFSVAKGTYRGKDVAVRILSLPSGQFEESEFINKALIMAETLHHKAIVDFIGFTRLFSCFTLVTELCKFGSIDEAIANYPNEFTEGLKVKCLLDVSEAILYLHASGFVHRCLEPANIGVVSLSIDQDVSAKLTDCSVAVDLNDAGMKEDRFGSAFFLSPELLAMEEGVPYAPSVDSYAFGMIMFVVFTGLKPHCDYGDINRCLQAIRRGERPEIPATCNSEIANMIRMCWSNEPSSRPSFDVIHAFFQQFFDKHFRR